MPHDSPRSTGDVDAIYEEILQGFGQAGQAHEMDFAVALILCLCDHLGDEDAIRHAITTALHSLDPLPK